MRAKDIVEFVRKNIEPLPAQAPYGERYRVAGILNDGTALPCIVVESAEKTIDLAIRRFDEERNPKHKGLGYRDTVATFVTSGNTVNDYDIRELAPSPHAIPPARLHEIRGETAMSWTEFYVLMKDGAEFRFGTMFSQEFFEMPQGYTTTDILKVIPPVRGATPRHEHIYRERPFFTCYVKGL